MALLSVFTIIFYNIITFLLILCNIFELYSSFYYFCIVIKKQLIMKTNFYRSPDFYPVPRSRKLQATSLLKYCYYRNLDLYVEYDPKLKCFDVYKKGTLSLLYYGDYHTTAAFLYGVFCQKFHISSKTY